jgi:hypothetical protein
MRHTRTLLPAIVLALATPTPAPAAQPSGTAVAVLQSAEANGHTLAVQAPVFTGDKIVTGPVGQAQLLFRDQTRLVIGPNSRLTIDAFIFKANTPTDVSINATKGAFRFITGIGPKQAYSIKTPEATIGVQGTKFDFSVTGGRTNFVLYEGAARLCDHTGHCTTLSGACSVATVSPHRPVERTPAASRAATLATFPFLRAQRGLRRDFRVDTSSCSVQRTELIPGGAGNPARLAPSAPPAARQFTPPAAPQFTPPASPPPAPPQGDKDHHDNDHHDGDKGGNKGGDKGKGGD